MDKRTLLAFGLIFVVMIGWSYLYRAIYGSPVQEGAADSTRVATESSAADVAGAPAVEGDGFAGIVSGGAAAEGAATPGGAMNPTEKTPAEYLDFDVVGEPGGAFRVETPLYRIEIDPRGGHLRRWNGKLFRGSEGEGEVDLIPVAADHAEPGGDLIFFEHGELDLSGAVFTSEGPGSLDLTGGDRSGELVLRADTRGGVVVRKVFTFHPDRYDFDLALQVEQPDGGNPWVGEAVRVRFVWDAGIASTERKDAASSSHFRSFVSAGDDLVFRRRADLRKGAAKVSHDLQGSVKFAGLQNKYFHIAGLVPAPGEGRVIEGRAGIGGDPDRGELSWWLELPLREEERRGTAVSRLRLYFGPSLSENLREMGGGLDHTVELGARIVRPLTLLLLKGMHLMHRWVTNYGLIIVIFSVLTKLAFYPLTQSSTRSMKKMAELQPKLKAIQAKYKDNREKASQETMRLYKEEKVNPLGGCLPLLLQMPIFIALYQGLYNDIALRQKPFVSWITDLAQPDVLFELPVRLPFVGNEFHLLPVLMAVGMYFQSKLTPTTVGTGGQMAMMNALLPFFMLFVFYNMPSGLVIYWTVNTVMQLYQSWRINVTAPAAGGAK